MKVLLTFPISFSKWGSREWRWFRQRWVELSRSLVLCCCCWIVSLLFILGPVYFHLWCYSWVHHLWRHSNSDCWLTSGSEQAMHCRPSHRKDQFSAAVWCECCLVRKGTNWCDFTSYWLVLHVGLDPSDTQHSWSKAWCCCSAPWPELNTRVCSSYVTKNLLLCIYVYIIVLLCTLFIALQLTSIVSHSREPLMTTSMQLL